MTVRSKFTRFQSRTVLLGVFAALVTAGTALPQSNSSSGNAVKDTSEGAYSLVDVSAFFGTEWYQIYQGSGKADAHQFFLTRPETGFRVTENLTKYVSLEEAFTLGFNRFAILPTGAFNYITVASHNTAYSLGGKFYMKPRDSRFRPYAVAGPAMVVYYAGNISQPSAPAAPITLQPASLRTKEYAALMYGFGADAYLNRHIGFEYDLRGFWSPKTADFGLPNIPNGPGSLYITHNHGESSLAFTVAVMFRFGYHEPPPPPAPAPPPPPPAPKANVQVGAIQGAHDVCPGDNLRLTVTASGWLPDQTPSYQWTINNRPAPGGTGSSFNPNTTTPGNLAIRVTVSAGDSMASSGPVNVTVRQSGPPTIQFSVSPTTINYGDRLPLNATARGSDCGGAVTVRYSASEGTITGTTYDSSGVAFDMANRLRQQSKAVTLTATATDTKNQTASANANVTVLLKPQASRQDIVFANRSARVNNAAKRYLIEQLTPRLRDDPNSTVILIGHRDMSETGRAAANLDHERVYNTAAVLSAGKQICPQLDLSRVQVAYAGTDQTDPPMPFADSSVKERRGQGATDQRAQFRRVEVWFVPGGADKPNVPGVEAAPTQPIQAKGCPR